MSAPHGLAPGVVADIEQRYASWQDLLTGQVQTIREGINDPDNDWPDALIANELAQRLLQSNPVGVVAVYATAILRLARQEQTRAVGRAQVPTTGGAS